MVEQCFPNQSNMCQSSAIFLESDLAGEFPLYLYWPRDRSTLLYSKSIVELLNDYRVPKPLQVCLDGLSFLLQSGLIQPPKTAYKDIYIIGIGDKACVSFADGKVEVKFSHHFPFLNANRLSPEEIQPDEKLILEKLADATINRFVPSVPSFLFHSAGKDSNSIALALAEAGLQEKVTLITHKSKGKADESEISAKIAKLLGFKHRILHEVDKLSDEHILAINNYFINAPFPCTDNVALAYPLYAHQLPELIGANIIDGGGNDCHMMTPPSLRAVRLWPITKHLHRASLLRNYIKSESFILPLISTPAERCGMSGLSYADSKKILIGAVNVYDHWRKECQFRESWDLIDFRTDILTTITAAEVHIRKARNFADSIKSNLIIPFANTEVATYFSRMPEKYVFDRATSKNKIILREMLKRRVGIDSDEIGKMEFSYDSQSIVTGNMNLFITEIIVCKLWDRIEIEQLVLRLVSNIERNLDLSKVSCFLIYRLFTISAWYNKCIYFK